ncbi:MAG: hypothetical protein ABIA21_01555 [Candidatus Aenigmatarchaeota archaeon]
MAEGRRGPLFNMTSFLIVIVVILLLVFVGGYLLSRTCVNVEGKDFCWSSVAHEVTSDLCPAEMNGTCIITPAVEQHNSLVDALLYACDKNSTSANNKIVDMYGQMSGQNLTADEICSGDYLSKWGYE